MSKKPWMKLYVGDIALRSRDMSLTQKGILLELIMLMWDTGYVTTKKAERVIGKPMSKWGPELIETITHMPNGDITMDFLLMERELCDARTDSAKEAATRRWIEERRKRVDAVALRSHSEGIPGAMLVEGDTEKDVEKKKRDRFSPTQVMDVIGFLESLVGGKLQKSEAENYANCYDLLRLMGDKYPEEDPIEKSKDLIRYGKQTWWGAQMVDFRFKDNYLKIIETIKRDIKEGKIKVDSTPKETILKYEDEQP